ncbi:beta/gamma crystallin-related protein [Pseudoduganella sp. OTU4001]|uniref:beta/gamma crystallin-related protein n=1 Tax=Pseudoduganella sp. OTU4001 TaxID=3043854 RepID=UPI00313BED9F
MHTQFKLAAAAAAALLCSQAWAQITLYPQEGWRGRPISVTNSVRDMRAIGFDDRASSIVVERGRWEVCEHPNFRGECRILRRGSYASLEDMGLNDSITSIRAVPRNRRFSESAYAPGPRPEAAYEYRMRPSERTFEAPITSARAVVGPPEQRCWVERQQVSDVSGGNNAAGAIAGALIGGVLGHQVGGGSGRDLATVGGAIAGAAVGSNVARQGSNQYAQNVQRCESMPSRTPQYWDVTYEFRGIEHRAQLASEPGRYITVNREGVPRM